MIPIDTVQCLDAYDFLRSLPEASVHCIVTSTPYYMLRDYGVDGQIGLEDTPQAFIARLVKVFHEARRVLRGDGLLWVNIGDSYASGEIGRHDSVQANDGRDWSGTKKGVIRQQKYITTQLPPKSLLMIPARLAIALQENGWILRSEIVWAKPNPMPESVTDRCTKAHEMIYMLAKSERYYFDADAIKEPAAYDGRKDTLMKGSAKYKASVVPGQSEHTMAIRGSERWQTNGHGDYVRNKRDVWTVVSEPNAVAHFATFPTKLIEPMILAGCPADGIVLDPFVGSGTTALVARRLGRHYIGCDINPEYVAIARKRLSEPYTLPLFAEDNRQVDTPQIAGLWEDE